MARIAYCVSPPTPYLDSGMTTSTFPLSATTRARKKSKLLTVFLAFIAGAFGAHRFYLKGALDIGAWLHLLSTLLGIAGAALLWADDFTSLFGWVTALAGCASLVGGFLAALIYGLRPDDKWDAQFNPDGAPTRSGWPVVILLILSLMIGTGILMAVLAFSFQSFFESQVEAARALSQE